MSEFRHMVNQVRDDFSKRFGDLDNTLIARAPGRVNLIGEHTDYNDGYVFPAAIDREIVIVGRATFGEDVTLYSADYDEESVFNVSDIQKTSQATWSNYIRGVVDVLQRAGYTVGGFQATLTGNVPLGAGLSSSAALEVATIALLDGLFELNIDKVERARLAQRAENEFVGVACGIMDQFISSAGKADHALFLDCRTLDYQLIPLKLESSSIVVVNTNKRRGLVDSEYNTRRSECEEAVRLLSKNLPGITALRDVSVSQFQQYESTLPPQIAKRARHVVTECDRVLKSMEALESGDLDTFGKLMDASHDSLRDDFEVSCTELDTVVDIARRTPGVLGARMTGAGFGGCAVVLVKDEHKSELVKNIEDQYAKATGLKEDIYVVAPSNGAEVISS